MYAGASVYYVKSLKTVVGDIQKVKATILLGVPLLYDKMYKRISKAIEESKIKSLVVPTLKSIISFAEKFGMQELRKKVFKEIHEKFGGAAPDPVFAKGLRSFGFNFIQGYG